MAALEVHLSPAAGSLLVHVHVDEGDRHARIIYWDASLSNATLKACEGLTPTTYTTAVRTFTVSTIIVQSSGEAAVKLTCTGINTCTVS